MSTPIELTSLDLAGLVASRVCHDVISPVGAIVNGLEVLDDEQDASMREFALDLIRKSARQASARLKFARLAFGAAGGPEAQIDTGDAEEVTRGLLADSKTQLDWQVPRLLLPKNHVKLVLNMVVAMLGTIPRGGRILVEAGPEGAERGFRLTSTGQAARIPADLPAVLGGDPPGGKVDSHMIQPFFTGVLAREAGMNLAITQDGDSVTLAAGSF